MSGQPLVSLISINYNQLEVTLELLASLEHLTYPNYEVIVVDNASEESPVNAIGQAFPHVRVIRCEENLGFSGGNNVGIEASQGEFLFFVNNDTEVTPELVTHLVQYLQAHPKVALVSPLICYGDRDAQGNDVIQYAGTTPVNPLTARNTTLGEGEIDQGQFDTPGPTAYVHGAAMMIRRSVMEQVGKMPEVFFLYYEELDWSEQFRRAGYEMHVQPLAKIYHKESVSVGPQSPLKTYYLTRNRLLFVRRNRTKGQVWAFVLFMIALTIPKNSIQFILKGQFTQLKAFYRGLFWHLNHNSKDVSLRVSASNVIQPASSPQS